MVVIAGFSRRRLLTVSAATAAALAAQGCATNDARRSATGEADVSLPIEGGVLSITALNDRAMRVRFYRSLPAHNPYTEIITPRTSKPGVRRSYEDGDILLATAHIQCRIDAATGRARFYDGAGALLLSEAPGSRSLSDSTVAGEPTSIATQSFDSPADERIYGTGCFQDGALNVRALPRRLTQVNTQISLPFILSSKGYGLLWRNTGMAEFNPPSIPIQLQGREVSNDARNVNATTTAGNAQIERRDAVFEGRFAVETPGRHAFLLDVGRKMASRIKVEIDGVAHSDVENIWLPPTTSFIADLPTGDHLMRVTARDGDSPQAVFGPTMDLTTWRSPVAEAIEYVVIAGPSGDDIMRGYRDILGAAPLLPKWAYGYIHCRERYRSSEEIIANAREFRARNLPLDVIVQDWQYWGRHGWNAMRFDEEHYPDPAGLVQSLHEIDTRLMLSVWAKVSRDTDLGRDIAARGYYISGTDWIDFFNPEAAAYYWRQERDRLAALGIDAWWQDATEPENDDLVGRQTAAGPGERVRLSYPLHVARAVYEGQRADFSDRRVMILTRSAFLGQHRYAAPTWSGDIGNDWDTLRRQIPAGLNMAAAGYPYWTVDAGGFFRPGESQYTDEAYRERLLRWFQYATFLPLQRVHGYQSNTEFWRYGERVETIAREYLNLRYRLLPYIYSTAAETWRTGAPIIRPLVFDFPRDSRALEERHTYMFGRAFHVAPVLAPSVSEWPVYLPDAPGGWWDFWTGEHRASGQVHAVAAPLTQLPVHVRAGAIVPLGPAVQSTADATGEDIALHVFAGRDGAFELYEDGGLDYAYENGAFSTIPLRWREGRRVLEVGRRSGAFNGMLEVRTFNVVVRDSGGQHRRSVVYEGRATLIRI